jgi:peroxiredoxin
LTRFLPALSLAFALAGCQNELAERPRLEPPPGPTLGQPAPAFEANDLEGNRVRLADLRGRAVLLNAWATWCLPCLEEMPELEQLHSRHSAVKLVVVGVSIDDLPPGEIQAFLDENGITYRNLQIRVDDIAEAFDWGRGVPKTALIDAEGMVRGYWAGRFRPFEPDNETLIGAVLGDEPGRAIR